MNQKAARSLQAPLPFSYRNGLITAANGDMVATVCEYGPQSEMPDGQALHGIFLTRSCNEFEARGAVMQTLSAKIDRLETENRSLTGICHMVDRDIELVGEVSAKTVDAARAAIHGTALIPYLSADEIAAAAFSQFGIVAEDEELVAFAEWILKNNSCAGAA